MNWADERYVRVYTRDTPTWVMLPWQAKACLPLIFRKCDRAGVLELGTEGLEGLAVTIGLPVEVVIHGVAALAKKGIITLTDVAVVVPNFIDAQETPQSDAARQRAHREKRRDLASAQSRAVTPGHAASQPVTPSRAVPSRADPAVPVSPETQKPTLDAKAAVVGRFAEIFREVTGEEYRGEAGRDMASAEALLKCATLAEIERRARLGLTASYRQSPTLRQLLQNWDHFALKGPSPPRHRAAGEADKDQRGTKFKPDGNVDWNA